MNDLKVRVDFYNEDQSMVWKVTLSNPPLSSFMAFSAMLSALFIHLKKNQQASDKDIESLISSALGLTGKTTEQ